MMVLHLNVGQFLTLLSVVCRELHLSSSSPSDFIATTQSFSQSVATMSIIGYIFGLGDRHLDNILLDVTSGEVVHIDYNVCFEKGRRLRVPEVVPFRLTQNFVKALGPTGIEGSFRAACEHVLRLIRNSRETLLTLLEAFVYDPLVDWEPDRKSDLEKKAMERNISHTLLASRIVELKVPFKLNKEKLTKFLLPFQDLLDINTTTFRTFLTVQQQLARLQQEQLVLNAVSKALLVGGTPRLSVLTRPHGMHYRSPQKWMLRWHLWLHFMEMSTMKTLS